MTTRPGDDLADGFDLIVADDRHELTLTHTPWDGRVGRDRDGLYAGTPRLVTITAGCSCWCWTASATVNTAAPAYDGDDMPVRLTTLHTDHVEQAEATARADHGVVS